MIVIVGRYIFKPKNIKVGNVKMHEPCNRCVYVTVSTDTTFKTRTRVKVIVEYLERVRGRLT